MKGGASGSAHSMRTELTPEEQGFEDQFVAGLTERERDQYKIHLEAGGKPACKFVSDPDAPVYEGLTVSVIERDLEPFAFDRSATIQERSLALAEASKRLVQNIAALASDVGRYEDELDKRYRAAAKRLGLEHVLED